MWCFSYLHIFRNIPCYVTSEVSLKRFYFALFDDGRTFKNFEIGVYQFLHSNTSFASYLGEVFVDGDVFAEFHDRAWQEANDQGNDGEDDCDRDVPALVGLEREVQIAEEEVQIVHPGNLHKIKIQYSNKIKKSENIFFFKFYQ